jgi:hypothetical protein
LGRAGIRRDMIARSKRVLRDEIAAEMSGVQPCDANSGRKTMTTARHRPRKRAIQ